MIKRYHIFFYGTVQGVGFRYTARALAEKYEIKGWVMNTTSGEVELEVEADSKDLENFLQDLKEEFKSYIKNINTEEFPPTKKFQDFRIRFY